MFVFNPCNPSIRFNPRFSHYSHVAPPGLWVKCCAVFYKHAAPLGLKSRLLAFPPAGSPRSRGKMPLLQVEVGLALHLL